VPPHPFDDPRRNRQFVLFYEWGTEEELETALREWLRQTIRELEMGEKTEAQGAA
jgi:hypothetical protein